MKKLLIIAMALLGSAMVSRAQDVITLRNGENILAKVLEVSQRDIKYKKFTNLNGPTYTVDIIQVQMIRYENGEKDIFNEEPAGGMNYPGPVLEDLKYREIKNLYNSKNYIKQIGDRYSPGWLGFASFIIPGLGQAIEGEWWRAAGFFLGSVTLSSIVSNNINVTYTNGTAQYEATPASRIFALATLAFDIWNICDAVHVAKVKNMYYQDIRAQRGLADFDVRLEPFVASVPSPVNQGFTPSAGLSFKVTIPNK